MDAPVPEESRWTQAVPDPAVRLGREQSVLLLLAFAVLEFTLAAAIGFEPLLARPYPALAFFVLLPLAAILPAYLSVRTAVPREVAIGPDRVVFRWRFPSRSRTVSVEDIVHLAVHETILGFPADRKWVRLHVAHDTGRFRRLAFPVAGELTEGFQALQRRLKTGEAGPPNGDVSWASSWARPQETVRSLAVGGLGATTLFALFVWIAPDGFPLAAFLFIGALVALTASVGRTVVGVALRGNALIVATLWRTRVIPRTRLAGVGFVRRIGKRRLAVRLRNGRRRVLLIPPSVGVERVHDRLGSWLEAEVLGAGST